MGWRFRQSFKVIPGVRLNLSKSGLSCSIGGAPLTLNVGPRRVYGTASLPGTGISYKQRFDGSETPQPALLAFPPLASPPSFPVAIPAAPIPVPGSFPVSTIPVGEVHSASTEVLTSESLKEFKQLIQATYAEHEDISCELETARQEQQRASQRYISWRDGFLFKKLFKKKFAQRKASFRVSGREVFGASRAASTYHDCSPCRDRTRASGAIFPDAGCFRISLGMPSYMGHKVLSSG